MENLAVTAVIVIALAIFGGPTTYLLSRFSPRSKPFFWLHRILTTILGIFSTLMGFTLAAAQLSIFIRILGGLGILAAAFGLFKLYSGNTRSRR